MVSFQAISNLIYLVSAYFHLQAENYLMTLALCILAVSSYMYHGLLHKRQTMEPVRHESLKFWQKMDVCSIYLVLGLYPHALTENPWGLLFGLPMILLILNKFDMFYPHISVDSTLTVGASAVIIMFIAYFEVPHDYFISGVAFLVLAQIWAIIANKLRASTNYKGYNKAHGMWHEASGVTFALIT